MTLSHGWILIPFSKRMIKGDRIGEGTYGIVYSGYHEGKELAVKRNLVDRSITFSGVLREVDLLTKLKGHPFIVTIHYVAIGDPFNKGALSPLHGTERRDDIFHFVLDKAQYDLHDLIYKLYPSYADIRRVMAQLLIGLEYMHSQGIIHRDIKPGNILMVDGYAQFCDFGMSKAYTLQQKGTPSVTTAWYRAPEMTLGQEYDFPVDIWSLGVVFYELIARRALFLDVSDNHRLIIKRIFDTLPVEPTVRGLNPPLTPSNLPRISFMERANLSEGDSQRFIGEVGPLGQFEDLLQKMICFDEKCRITPREALDHPFFGEEKEWIDEMRRLFPPIPPPAPPIAVIDCIERRWVMNEAFDIYNRRHSYTWYHHRILFQAISLFDRYLGASYPSTSPFVENTYQGLLHNQEETFIRFMVCLYAAIKYFTSHLPITFYDLLPDTLTTERVVAIATQFEITLIQDILVFDVYKATLYETADRYGIIDSPMTRDLLIITGQLPTYNGLTFDQLFRLYGLVTLSSALES